MPYHDEEFTAALNKADKIEHPVEKQWHYPILMAAGFRAVTTVQKGFVRTYRYEHPDGRVITAHTGMNADYWVDEQTKQQGLWRQLEIHLKKATL